MYTIDLGELSHADEIEFGGPDRIPRPSPWFVALVLLVVCASGLTAAGQPEAKPELVLHVTGVGEPARVSGESVYAQLDSADGPVLTSYGLTDGRVRWRHRPPRRATLVPAGPVALLAPTTCRSASTFATEALDAVTGEPRWQVRGVPIWTVPGTTTAVFKQPVSGCTEATVGFDPTPSAPFTWAGVDLPTGAIRWTVEVPPRSTLSVGADADGQATWLAVRTGPTISAYDLRTGAAAGTMAAPPDPLWPAFVRILGAGDILMVLRRDENIFRLTGYTAPDLTERWRQDVPAARGGIRLQLDNFVARDCGPTLCLGPSSETVGLDPASGREIWRLPGRPVRIGPRHALFVRPPSVPGPAVFEVFDLITGASVRALPETELLGRLDGGLMFTTPVQSGNRLWRLALDTGRIDPLTTLPRAYADCDAAGRYLACRTGAGSLQVWRMPPGCLVAATCAAVPDAKVGPE